MLTTLMNHFKLNIKHTMVVMSLPVILYFMIGPLSVYCANLRDYHFYISDFFYVLAIVGVVIWLLGSVIISVLPCNINKIACTALSYIGIMSYVQDMWLNVKLAEDNGGNMDWGALSGVTRTNTAIWLTAFIVFAVLAIMFKGRFVKTVVYISGFICAVQIVTLVSLFISGISIESNALGSQDYGLVGDLQYTVGSENNVIVFVVDTWGSTQLEAGLSENSHLIDDFKDFTYYDNADSVYFRTFPSMTHMLTGVDVDFSKTTQEYLFDAWNDENARGFYDVIHDAGYEFYLYSTGGDEVYGDAANQYGLIDNVKPITWNVDKNAALVRMAKISIYKYVPYIIKPRFEVVNYLFGYIASYADARDINCGNTLYYDGLKACGLSVSDTVKDSIIIQHIDGTHTPYTTSSECEGTSEGTLLSTQEGIVFEITEYMNQLKELGLYDSATIIITADHSSWTYENKADDPQIVYFVKRPMQQQDSYVSNSAPISHDDFRATILSIIGQEYTDYGKSIFDYGENELRERMIVNQEYDDSYQRVAGSVSNIYSVYSYIGGKDDFISNVREHGADEVYTILRDK